MTRRSRVAKVFSEISALLSAPSKWLRVTLRGPGRLDNILHVLIKLTATLESPVTTQTDPSVRLLRSAYRGGVRGDLDAAAGPYDRAISQNSDNAEAYFLKARNLTYLRGKLALLDR